MGYIGTQPIPRASRVLTEGTLSSDTSTINVPGGFTPNNIAVYITGTRLRQTEYDDSSGSEIDLLDSFPDGTEYVIEEFRSFEIPNHFTKAESDDRYAQQTDVLNAVTEASNYSEAISMMGQGAIVGSGSNDDGNYVRWENGEQIATRVESINPSELTDTTSELFDFAAEFVDVTGGSGAPRVSASPFSSRINTFINSVVMVDGNGFRFLSESDQNESNDWRMFAWGFWK